MNLVPHRLTRSAAARPRRRTAPHAVMAAWLAVAALGAAPVHSAASTPPAPRPDPAPEAAGPQPDAAPVRSAPKPARTMPSEVAAPQSGVGSAAPQTTTPVTPAAAATTHVAPAGRRRHRTPASRRTRRHAAPVVPAVSAGIVPPRFVALTRTAQRHDTGALLRGGLALLVLSLAGAALLDLSLRLRRGGPARG